jgi:hypothetical protein
MSRDVISRTVRTRAADGEEAGVTWPAFSMQRRLWASRSATLRWVPTPLPAEKVPSNIAYFDVTRVAMTAPDFAARLRTRSVLVLPTGEQTLRAVVTHCMVGRQEILRALNIIREELF